LRYVYIGLILLALAVGVAVLVEIVTSPELYQVAV
jgi:hypothetical protein